MTSEVDGRKSHSLSVIVGITTTALVVGTVSFALRLYARRCSKAKLWLDDLFVGIGLFFAAITCICDYVGISKGLGHHIDELRPSQPKNYLLTLFVLELCWVCALACIKTGILLFYWRLFPRTRFRRAVLGVLLFVWLTCLVSFCVMLFQCRPVSGFWLHDPRSRCINQVAFYLATAGLNIVSDVLVLSMPVPVVWNLKVSHRQKLGLTVVFLLGAVVCIVSLVRLISLTGINLNDMTYTNLWPGLWSAVEVELGVVSANLPLMRPLLRRVFQQQQSSEHQNSINRHDMPSQGRRSIDTSLQYEDIAIDGKSRHQTQTSFV